MRELLDRHLGEGWMERAAQADAWAGVDDIPDDELWNVRRLQRDALVTFIRARSTADRLMRGDLPEYVDAAARAFDPDVLTLGFARRVATYKRLELLTRDPEWTLSLLDIQPDDRIREVGCDPGALTSRPPCCSRLQSATPRPSGKGGCDWGEAPPRLSPLKVSRLTKRSPPTPSRSGQIKRPG